jgi:hypothetical protein
MMTILSLIVKQRVFFIMIKVSKKILIEMNACEYGVRQFMSHVKDENVELNALDLIDSDNISLDNKVWFATRVIRDKGKLVKFACNCALINIEKVRPYCNETQYQFIIDYLKEPAADAAADAAYAAADAARAARAARAAAAADAAYAATYAADTARAARAARAAAYAAADYAADAAAYAAYAARAADAADAAYAAYAAYAAARIKEHLVELLSE